MQIIESLHIMLEESGEKQYPDIHLGSGKKPMIRNNNGEIEIFSQDFPILDNTMLKDIIIELSNTESFERFLENMELDSSYQFKNGKRYRVNCYMDSRGYSIALRLIPDSIPSMQELWLWNNIKQLCDKQKGLILVTGPTGSGKSTNLAAMVDYINSNYKKHIITIEDPVEFNIVGKSSLVNQREVWNHTHSFANAIRWALREDPDVIMIWEMRDPETIKAALTLAETWHLVLSTLHTNDSIQTVDRIIDSFPAWEQSQIRMQLSQSLAGVVCQRLVARSDKPGRIAAREILINNSAIANLIIWGKTNQMYWVLEVAAKEGMILMDKYLVALYKKNIISKPSLLSYARDGDSVEMMID